LRLLQCDQMQGYLISKPLSFRDMSVFLGRARAKSATAGAAKRKRSGKIE
jgi:hypothetical protein